MQTPPPPPPPDSGNPPPAGSAPQPPPISDSTRNKVVWPAIILMVFNIFSLLGTGLVLFIGGLFFLASILGISLGHVNFGPISGLFPIGGLVGIIGIFAIFFLALGIGKSLFCLIAANRMRKLQSYGMALTGSIVMLVVSLFSLPAKAISGPSLVVFGGWTFFEIAAAIWALIVLLQDDVKLAFRQRETVSNSSPQTRPHTTYTPPPRPSPAPEPVGNPLDELRIPSIGLIVSSAINLLAAGLLVVLVVIRLLRPDYHISSEPMRPMWSISMLGAGVLILGSVSLLIMVAAWRMQRGKNYGLAVVAAILAIILPQGFILGIVFGIWTLVVLSRDRVRNAFTSGGGFVGGCLIALLCLLFPLLLIGGAVFYLYSSARVVVHTSTVTTPMLPAPMVPAPSSTTGLPQDPAAQPVEAESASKTPDETDSGGDKASPAIPHWSTSLDLSSNWVWQFKPDAQDAHYGLMSLLGHHTWDGLPFNVGGQATLTGEKMPTKSDGTEIPERFSIPVSHTFDELHLLHATHWQDPVGVEVATLHIIYDNGRDIAIPLRYGVHVIDWQRLPGEEVEPLSDPDSKIVWRGEGTPGYRASARVVETLIHNPRPEESVERLEFVSGHTLASYTLVAATISDSDPDRETTPPVPPPGGERHYIGEVRIRVLDAKTGAPLGGTFLNITGTFEGVGLIAQPVFTDALGVARLHYDPDSTSNFSVNCARADYTSQDLSWASADQIPDEAVVKLLPSGNSESPPSVVRGSFRNLITKGKLSTILSKQSQALWSLANASKNESQANIHRNAPDTQALTDLSRELASRHALPGCLKPPAHIEPPVPSNLNADGWDNLPASALEDAVFERLTLIGQNELTLKEPESIRMQRINETIQIAAMLSDRETAPDARRDHLPVIRTDQMQHKALASRLDAAKAISNWETRDSVLSKLAVDSAKLGEASISTQAIQKMSNWETRDQTASQAAMQLNQLGFNDAAVAIAKLISNWETRDKTLQELSSQ